MRRAIALIKASAANFGADGAATHAAAIAYSAIFAIAPLLIVGIGIAGEAFAVAGHGPQRQAIEDHLIGGLGAAIGSANARSVGSIVDASFASHQGSVLAQALGWFTFVVAASSLFLTLQNALNAIWHVKPTGGWMQTVRDRAISLVMVAVVGAVVVISMVGNVVLALAWRRIVALLPIPDAGALLAALEGLLAFALIALLFAVLFKVLPDTEVAWRDVRAGALVTAALFLAGEALVSIYISRTGIANGYGAAGSLVVLLVWVYYSALLLLFGAEITQALSRARTPAATLP